MWFVCSGFGFWFVGYGLGGVRRLVGERLSYMDFGFLV